MIPRLLRASPTAFSHLITQGLAAHCPPDDFADVAFLGHGCVVSLRHPHHRHLGELLVAPLEKALLDVGDGVEEQIVLQVVHRMLCDVRHAQVLMFPNLRVFKGFGFGGVSRGQGSGFTVRIQGTGLCDVRPAQFLVFPNLCVFVYAHASRHK